MPLVIRLIRIIGVSPMASRTLLKIFFFAVIVLMGIPFARTLENKPGKNKEHRRHERQPEASLEKEPV